MRRLRSLFAIVFGLATSGFSACSGIQTGAELTDADIAYIKGLGLLDNQEKIILFETHSGWFGGKRISGNYFTDKRIAGYWIDKSNKKRDINSAFYNEIDTITTTDLSSSLTMASYLIIKKTDGQEFKVFISPSRSETSLFFSRAISEWKKHQRQRPTQKRGVGVQLPN